MEQFSRQLASGAKVKDLWKETAQEGLEKQGLFFTLSAHDTLVYWSSSLVAFDNQSSPVREEGVLKRLPTGWYYLFTNQGKGYTVTGYLLLKRDFPYQNRYVQSAFQDDFGLSDQCEVVPDEQPGNIQVFCHEGKFHFGIHYREKPGGSNGETIPEFLFFLLFVVLITVHFSKWMSGRGLKPWFKFTFSVLFAAAFYLMLNYFKVPEGVYANKIFTPFHFAWSWGLSSLGDTCFYPSSFVSLRSHFLYCFVGSGIFPDLRSRITSSSSLSPVIFCWSQRFSCCCCEILIYHWNCTAIFRSLFPIFWHPAASPCKWSDWGSFWSG